MGSRILMLVLASLLSVVTAGAESFFCRDSNGTLFFADSPAKLPDECQGKVEKVEPEKGDALNIVPAAPEPKGSGAEFERSVSEVEQQQHQQHLQTQELLERAKQLADQYREAVVAKRRALRSWSYSSREQIDTADQRISEAREGKQELLQALDKQRLAPEKERKIKQTLNEIEDQ